MTDLTQDQRVIADSAVDGIYKDGTADIAEIVIGEEGKDFWRFPLSDEVVERLAKTAYHANIDHWLSRIEGPKPTIPHIPWEKSRDSIRDTFRAEVRAIFAELMGER